jgi:four helix bundle protein
MTPEQLRGRTKQFALDIIALVGKLPRTLVAEIIARQLVRASTSVRPNYRSACRGRSRGEFAAEVAVALEEADEDLCWLQILDESGIFRDESAHVLMKEAGELIAILAASCNTARARR